MNDLKKHIIILINGKRRSGKGLLTESLKKHLAEDFKDIKVLSFAEPIKTITKPILDEIEWDGKDKEVVRPLWIAMGEVGRNIDPDIWCARTFNKIIENVKVANDNGINSLYLIDDMRFPNELDYFKGNISKIKNLVSDAQVKILSIRIEKFMDASKFVVGVDDNITETSFDKLVNICFDYIVPAKIMVNENGVANFDNVTTMTQAIIANLLK